MSRIQLCAVIALLSVSILACGGLDEPQDALGTTLGTTRSAATTRFGDHALGDDRGGHVESTNEHGVAPDDWKRWGSHPLGDDRGGHPTDRERTLKDMRSDTSRARVGTGKPHLDTAPSPLLTLGARCNNVCDCNAGQFCGVGSGTCELQGDAYHEPCCTWSGCAPEQTCMQPDATRSVCE